MIDARNQQAIGTALAGGAIASALVETLFDKGILTRSEARGVLDRAMRALSPVIQTTEGAAACQIIASALRTKFSERS